MRPSTRWMFVVCLLASAVAVRAQLGPPPPAPAENPFSEQKRVLGKILFWDEQLSSDDTVACGTCHIPTHAGADPRIGQHPGPDGTFDTEDDVIGSPGIVRRDANNQPIEDPLFGFGVQVTRRSAQSYFMSMYSPELFWDGRASTVFVNPLDSGDIAIATGGALESQAVGPVVSDVEMAHEDRDWSEVTSKLATVAPLALAADIPQDMLDAMAVDPTYPDLFETAFGDAAITPVRMAFAIATYERTLVPDQAPWDLFMAGDTGAMTPDQIQGWNLFSNNTVCDNCHVAPLFTDNEFHNIGLRPAAEDTGRMEITGLPDDFGRFKTPSLRNIGLRSSLMHVGWVTDTQDAIDFYNSGNGVTETDHVQFTEDQTGIPTPNPNIFADYSDINMPAVTQGGLPMQARIIDFLNNGLTDPRVAAGAFPFDRPTLGSEQTAAPPAVPDGVVGSPLTAARVDAVGSVIDITWDVSTCRATDYELLVGSLSSVSSYALDGAECDLGPGGSYAWLGVPAGDLWFLVVSHDDGGTEGTWGSDSDGTPRAGTTASLECGNLARVNDGSCGPPTAVEARRAIDNLRRFSVRP